MSFPPTDEQQAAIDGFATGENLVIEAGAGTGKTSTLRYIADVAPQKRGLYLAFNKAIQTEAAHKFDGTAVTAKTAHSLAYAKFGRPNQHKLNAGNRMRAADRAKVLGINNAIHASVRGSNESRRIPNHVSVRLVGDAVNNFCRSGEREITADMVTIPEQLMLTDGEAESLRNQLLPYALKYWADIINPDGGLPYTHDFYLKQWALSSPKLEVDYILFDEAQDSDPLIFSVVQAQTHAQIVAVGDSNQAIYGWRGAVDAMANFEGDRFQLTQSFRFGEAIAEEANVWLDLLDASLRIRGSDKPSSVHESKVAVPNAVLCRTNAGAIGEVIDMQNRGTTTAISGKGKSTEMKNLALAAKSLIEEGWTRHPHFDTFKSWEEVQEYANEDDGADIAPLVKLVDQYTPERLISAIENCVPEDRARTVVATAHVAKGLEWRHVRIADDFKVPSKDDEGELEIVPQSDLMLAYVSVTRAMRHLDPAGLSWVRAYKRSLAQPELGTEWRRRHLDARQTSRDEMRGAA